ncbi:MAG: hypothetical protein EA365_06395 [Gloeocapsa sp. DLM2.Bin57]|nr:MAG: hypothetical protein EA365_06395 [Gloeocapsa sp. DLM2.Bin57]
MTKNSMNKAFNSLLPLALRYIGIFCLLFIPGKVFAQESQPTPHVYPEDFVTDYLADCRELAIAEGLLPEDADILCQCTIDKFQAQYSFEEYEQLSQEAKEEVGYDCFDELLFEDEETSG